MIQPKGYDCAEFSTVITVSKLSRLQRFILERAYKNRITESRGPDSKGADLYYSEVLAGFFGFPTHHADLRESIGGHKFDISKIGPRKYNAAQASISRTMLRLMRRGLVNWMNGVCSRWSGCNLTIAGVQAVANGYDKGQLAAVLTVTELSPAA